MKTNPLRAMQIQIQKEIQRRGSVSGQLRTVLNAMEEASTESTDFLKKPYVKLADRGVEGKLSKNKHNPIQNLLKLNIID